MTDALGETPPSAARAGIALDRVVFRYPGSPEALTLPGLDLPAGGRSAIVGPSGSGKTTLLHLLAGILVPASGSVNIQGFAMHAATPAARRRYRIERIGLIFQEFELLEHLTVRENIRLPFLLHRGHPSEAAAESRVRALTERAGIARYLDRKPARLSQGERQRVALCRALITDPPIVLADEPTGNLDPETTHRVLESLFDEIARHDATLVMVTHDRSLLPHFDRVIELPGSRVGAVP